MDDLSVIDRFMAAFIQYIDNGFGLLGGDVHFLAATLIGIDVTLAGLFWALGGEQDVMGRFIKKILYVGAFAYIIGNFSTLATIIFRSFAAAGVTASSGTISAGDLLKPGTLAEAGWEAGVLDFGSDMSISCAGCGELTVAARGTAVQSHRWSLGDSCCKSHTNIGPTRTLSGLEP